MLFAVALLYWLMIGLRFRVGADWDNYIAYYDHDQYLSLSQILVTREPAFALLNRFASLVGGGPILVNVIAALVFCIGVFSVARRCSEPMIPIVVATPLLMIAFGMSGTRQEISCGIIFYLFSTFEDRTTFARFIFVVLATLFHFSALFVMIFVVLGSNVSVTLRVIGASGIALLIGIILLNNPQIIDVYYNYIGAGRLEAPGAIFQVSVIAIAGFIYLVLMRKWIQVNQDNLLYRNLAWASVFSLPMILISSIATYRFSLYFWPMAMWVYGGLPNMIESGVARALYRYSIVVCSIGMLLGWLLFANNSFGYLPYDSWLLHVDTSSFHRPLRMWQR